MSRSLVLFAAVCSIVSLLFVGCGGEPATSQNPPPTGNGPENVAPNPDAAGTQQVNKPAADAAPDAVVTAFLESLRSGDESLAAALLTDVARTATARANLHVGPTSTPGVQYQIGSVNYVDENMTGAHVVCACTDREPNGRPYQYMVTWVMRRQPDGWRIVGFTTTPGQGEQEIFLNFENPAEMMEKVRTADARLAGAEPSSPTSSLE